jgi:hypothetical protein
MASIGLTDNAEARFRRRAVWAWRAALFLFALLAGAVAWQVILEPAWAAAAQQRSLSQDILSLGRAVARAATEHAPSIFVTVAAWDGAAILRRFAHGGAAFGHGATRLSHMGLAIALGGLMHIAGTPSLLGILDGGGAQLRFALEVPGLALLVLGLILRLAALALREA